MPFMIALRDPLLRIALLCILLMGPAVASITPFQSVIGIERLGFSKAFYALVVTLGALFSVTASIIVGILIDQQQRYRGVLLVCVSFGIAAGLLMGVAPTQTNFLIVHLVLFPITATTFTQYFTLAAVAAHRNPDLDKDVALSIVRAGFAGSFAISPPLWGLALARGVDLMAVYWMSAVINVLVFAIVFFMWPASADTKAEDGSGLSFAAAFREIAAFRVLARLGLMTAVTSANGLYNILLGLLVVNVLQGQESDIGWFAGGVALIELPVILGAAVLVRRFSRVTVILAGAALYGASLIALPFMPSMTAAWWLIIPFGLGAGIILSLPVGYIQDLVAHRPGAGSSLISLSHFGGVLLASGLFAVGSETLGYGGVSVIGAAVCVIAAILVYAIDQRERTASPQT